MGILWYVALLIGIAWLGPKLEAIFTANYRDDPVYKKNVQKLIERNRKLEESKE